MKRKINDRAARKADVFWASMVLAVLSAMLAALIYDAYSSERASVRKWRVNIAPQFHEPVRWNALAFRYQWNFFSDFDVRPTGPGPHCMCLFESGADSGINPYARVYSCPVPDTQHCDSRFTVWPHEGIYTLDKDHAYDLYALTDRDARYMSELNLNRKTDMSLEILAHEDGKVTHGTLFIEGMKAEDYLRAMKLSK